MEPHFRKAVLEINDDIAVLQSDISRLQVTRDTIIELYGGEETPIVQTNRQGSTESRPTKAKKEKTGGAAAKSKPALDVRNPRPVKPATEPSQSTSARLDEKADTVSGAMKVCARQLKTFTVGALLDKVKEDPDWKKLVEAGCTRTPYSSVAYWAETGKLKKEGAGATAVYTVVSL